MDKVFAVAGVSTLEGAVKARFAKDMGRVKVLEQNGHTNVRLMVLPKLMTKVSAVAFLVSHKDFQDAAAQKALKSFGGDEAAPKTETKAKAAPKAAPKTETKAKAAPKAAPKTETKAKAAPKTETKTPDEIAAIKAKNLQTIRKVGQSWQEHRDTVGEVMLLEAEAEIDARTEAGIPNHRWAGIGLED